jgi:hypothetical protein
MTPRGGGAWAWPARAAAMAATLGAAPPVGAMVAPEDAVEAAYVAKFPAFVRWPQGASRPDPVICVVGDDPVADDLVGLRPSAAVTVEVRRLAAIDAGSGCDVLYASDGAPQSVAQALAAVAGRPVLTVTDERGSADAGMIRLVIRQNRVRFVIDARQAEQSGLQISAKLLALAVAVKR